ncbi:MAG: response regulator [Acidobacteriota bacterium]|nr:response regulator [Acidobacteriota bacterium]
MIALEPRSKQTARVEPASSAKPNFGLKPLVLVAEDHEDSRLLLKTLLEMWGYRVAEAANGAEAISIAEQICPDLILMDVSLPVVDGIAAARRIHDFTNLARLPIVFTSGHAQTKLKEAALEKDAVDYLVKPIDFEKLKTALSKHIQQMV